MSADGTRRRRKQLRRWFELEQTYGHEQFRARLEAERDRLLQEFKRIEAFIAGLPRRQQAWYRRQSQIYFQHFDDAKLDKRLAAPVRRQGRGALQSLQALAKYHNEAHAQAIETMNKESPKDAPRITKIDFHPTPGTENDQAKARTGAIYWDDGAVTVLQVDAVHGKHTGQRVHVVGNNDKIFSYRRRDRPKHTDSDDADQ